MNRNKIPKESVNKLRKLFIAGEINYIATSALLKISRQTVKKYVLKFTQIREMYPEKLGDMNFFLPVKPVRRTTERNNWLEQNLLALIRAEAGPKLRFESVWKRYRSMQPDGYSHHPFRRFFFNYCLKNDISPFFTRYIECIPPEDELVLKHWRISNNHQQWKIAVVLEAAHLRKPLEAICAKVECKISTAITYIETYRSAGINGFDRKYTPNPGVTKFAKEKADNLIHLIQQSPKNYGIQKTAWSRNELVEVFVKTHQVEVSPTWVTTTLQKNNIRYKKAKEALTSPDPLYKEKFNAITHILENLGAKEKFFSIDEYGPFAVKQKGGRALTLPGTQRQYPQFQKSKGWFVMNAALELSTNQITYYYCKKKDTEEMIKLIDLLLKKYGDQDTLYLSWDAAAWHASKKLKAYIEMQNAGKGPKIALAPLPSCAQFLNVIESVFSGMSKTVIHNSDYDSDTACKAEIDRYFKKRNQFFMENPHKAGNKIWGRERVRPVFDKSNICKSPYHR